MKEEPSKSVPDSTAGQSKGGRNPLILFLGFLLLGAAFSLVLFGGEVIPGLSSTPKEEQAGDDQPVLDQLSEIQEINPAGNQVSTTGQSGGILQVGDMAYDFTAKDFDGNEVSLTDFRGQPVIVNFWATWCAPCRIEMPELQAAFEKYKDDGLNILALDQDEPVEIAKEYFYDEMDLTFTPLLDEDSAISTFYGSYNVLPATYIISPDGEITAIHRGPMTLSDIDRYLAEQSTISG